MKTFIKAAQMLETMAKNEMDKNPLVVFGTFFKDVKSARHEWKSRGKMKHAFVILEVPNGVMLVSRYHFPDFPNKP